MSCRPKKVTTKQVWGSFGLNSNLRTLNKLLTNSLYNYCTHLITSTVCSISCSKTTFFCLQMVQAIQVLRFHLLELEKVSVLNVLFMFYLREGIHFHRPAGRRTQTGFERKISPDIVRRYPFDYPRVGYRFWIEITYRSHATGARTTPKDGNF